MVSTFPWLKLTTELSNSEIDLIISTRGCVVFEDSKTSIWWPKGLKPSLTEWELWLLRNEPQIRLNVDLDELVEFDVRVLALLWRAWFFLDFLIEAMLMRFDRFWSIWRKKLMIELGLVIVNSNRHTVWKFLDFSATQILREINFDNSTSSKIAFFVVLEIPNFDKFRPEKCQKFLKINIQSL